MALSKIDIEVLKDMARLGIPGARAKLIRAGEHGRLRQAYLRSQKLKQGPVQADFMQRLFEKPAAYAPGIPDKADYGEPTKELDLGDIAEFVLQHHATKKRPKHPHYDLRLGVPGKTRGTFSWAIPNAILPEVGEKKLAPQSNVHSHDYSNFTGMLGKGYGQGTVTMAQRGKALITNVTPNTLSFTLADSRVPVRYTLVKLNTNRTTKDWLLLRKALPGALPGVGDKPVYKTIQADDLDEAMANAEDIQAKIDGASMVIGFGEKGIEAQSVNKSVKGEPVIHTERLGLSGIKVPKELQDTVVRAESFGIRKDKAIPFQEFSGLLNTNVISSLTNQRNRKIKMMNALFDVIQHAGKTPPGKYADRKRILEEIAARYQDKFIMPPSAVTPAEGKKLLQKIEAGKEPLTEEGLVLRMPGNKVLKYKLRPESTVYFAGVYPGTGQRKQFGGLQYSLTPGGPVVGNVGTGFSKEEIETILKNPDTYINKPMRIGHQGQFEQSKAYRAPAFQGWEDQIKIASMTQKQKVISSLLAFILPMAPFGSKLHTLLTKSVRGMVSPRALITVTKGDMHTPVRRAILETITNAPESAASNAVNRIKTRLTGEDIRKILQVTRDTEFSGKIPKRTLVVKKVIPPRDGRPATTNITTNTYYKLPVEHFDRSWSTYKGVPVTKFPDSKHFFVGDMRGWNTAISNQFNDYVVRDGLTLPQAMTRFSPVGDAAQRKIDALNRLGGIDWPVVVNTNKLLVKKSNMIKKIDCIPLAAIDNTGKVKATLNSDIADTSEKRKRGLSKIANLPDNRGMFFDAANGFWMKDCLIPLDVAFLTKTGEIVDIQTMRVSKLPDELQPIYFSTKKADYAVEANAGWFKKHNITVGDHMIVSAV